MQLQNWALGRCLLLLVHTHSPHHAGTRVGIDVVNCMYTTKYTAKRKAKFSSFDQIKFNEPVLKPGTPE